MTAVRTCSVCLTLAIASAPALGMNVAPSGPLQSVASATDAVPDPRGSSWLDAGPRRAPSGQPYLGPLAPEAWNVEGAWQWRGRVGLGVLAPSGDSGRALWDRYINWDGGLVLALLDLRWQRAADGSHASLRGHRISTEDAWFEAAYGRAGAYEIRAFLQRVPNGLADHVRSIWTGIGSAQLDLVDGLTPAASSTAEVSAAVAAAPDRRLSVTRSSQGLGFSTRINPFWSAHVDLTRMQREGARPFGGPFFFNFAFPNNAGMLETPRPIDDGTLGVKAGLSHVGPRWQFELGYGGSFYRDRLRRFSYAMPFALRPVIGTAVSAPVLRGQFATEPDNDFHHVDVGLSRRVGQSGEWRLDARLGQLRQNDKLIAPIDCEGVFGIGLEGSLEPGPDNPYLHECAAWNSSAALSRSRADLRIDRSRLDSRLLLHPNDHLSLRGGLRFEHENYRGSYLAFNPLTGAYGYVAENGAAGSIVPTAVGFWFAGAGSGNVTRIRNLPPDDQTLHAELGLDWQITPARSLGFDLDWDRREPGLRERRRIERSTFELHWVERSLDWLTLRSTLGHRRQRGDLYVADPYAFAYSPSLDGFEAPVGGVPVHTVAQLRKYDLADAEDDWLSINAMLLGADAMSLSATLRLHQRDYAAVLGRQRLDTASASLQWEWQPAPSTRINAHLGWDRSSLTLANVNDQSSGSDPNLGGSVYPAEGLWSVDDRQRNRMAGAGFRHDVGRVCIEADWNWIDSRGLTSYDYATPAAFAYFGDGAAVPDNRFPPMLFRRNALSLGLRLPLHERVSLHLFDRLERGRVRDWHYDGLDQNRVIGHRVYLEAGPRDYRANLLGLLVDIEL